MNPIIDVFIIFFMAEMLILTVIYMTVKTSRADKERLEGFREAARREHDGE